MALDGAREDLRQARDELTSSNAELARWGAELERRVEERTAALQAAHDELAALATTDPLTGLPNHRALVAALDQELERARRYGRSCSVLFLDLDHFKALNDSFGHAGGDAALRELGAIVRTRAARGGHAGALGRGRVRRPAAGSRGGGGAGGGRAGARRRGRPCLPGGRRGAPDLLGRPGALPAGWGGA